MKQNIWIYELGRTDPGKIHHLTGDGNITAVVEILREGDTDSREGVQFKKVTPMHLGTDQSNWKFGPNGEWLGPHGILFVYEDEYEDPHGMFARLEAIRQAGPQPTAITQPLDAGGAPAPGGNAEPVQPAAKEPNHPGHMGRERGHHDKQH